MSDLQRFKRAQGGRDGEYETALAEMRTGRKRSHWIWYVFPQLRGLGMSPESETFGIAGLDEATSYLRDPPLRARLLAVSQAAAEHLRGEHALRLSTLMGSQIDALKLVSSMTLFEHAARLLSETEREKVYADLQQAATVILDAAAKQGYARCAFTEAAIAEETGRADLGAR